MGSGEKNLPRSIVTSSPDIACHPFLTFLTPKCSKSGLNLLQPQSTLSVSLPLLYLFQPPGTAFPAVSAFTMLFCKSQIKCHFFHEILPNLKQFPPSSVHMSTSTLMSLGHWSMKFLLKLAKSNQQCWAELLNPGLIGCVV